MAKTNIGWKVRDRFSTHKDSLPKEKELFLDQYLLHRNFLFFLSLSLKFPLILGGILASIGENLGFKAV